MADFLSLPGDIADRKDDGELVELERFRFIWQVWITVLLELTLDAEWRLTGRAGGSLAAVSRPVVTTSAHAHKAGICLAGGESRLAHAQG